MDDNENISGESEDEDESFSTGEEGATSELETDDNLVLEEILSELDEEEYDYSDEEGIDIELNL